MSVVAQRRRWHRFSTFDVAGRSGGHLHRSNEALAARRRFRHSDDGCGRPHGAGQRGARFALWFRPASLGRRRPHGFCQRVADRLRVRPSGPGVRTTTSTGVGGDVAHLAERLLRTALPVERRSAPLSPPDCSNFGLRRRTPDRPASVLSLRSCPPRTRCSDRSTVTFALPKAGPARLAVYDLLGRERIGANR